jgi:hypothetical protein
VSRRALFYLIGGVVAAHIGLFALFAHMRALPQAPHTIPPANFGFHEVVREDSTTGETTTSREFTVSTQLSPVPKATPNPATR